VGVVGLVEYVCTHSCLVFTEEDPIFVPEDVKLVAVLHLTLPVVQDLHRKLTMAQDSDVLLDSVGTLVWLLVLMLSLKIVVLQCPLPRRFVR
jgi:hypothetical protein